MTDFVSTRVYDTLPAALRIAQTHASDRVPVASVESTAGDVRRMLWGASYDSASDIAVCDQGRLVGIVTIEKVLAAGDNTAVSALMDSAPPTVGPRTDQEEAAWTMVQHGERSLAVVDDDGNFLGLIPPSPMLGALLQEHDEDLARFSGLLATSDGARATTQESVQRRLLHRLPWLAMGLLGAMVSAWLVGSSEKQISERVELAFFLPAIVYMADAVGTQTEVLAVRGLSLGVPIRRFVFKEVTAGFFIGVLIALLFFPFCVLAFGDASIAAAVSLALLISATVASVVALLLPAVLNSWGRDPAFGSGPLSTVIQDLLSIAIYLLIARLFVV